MLSLVLLILLTVVDFVYSTFKSNFQTRYFPQLLTLYCSLLSGKKTRNGSLKTSVRFLAYTKLHFYANKILLYFEILCRKILSKTAKLEFLFKTVQFNIKEREMIVNAA